MMTSKTKDLSHQINLLRLETIFLIFTILTSTNTSEVNQASNVDFPRLITKLHKISSYEDQVVLLPCKGTNLPPDIHIVWQYLGKERSLGTKEILLTIGKYQVENNYRLRVVTNETNNQISNRYEHGLKEKNPKITTNDLEIRKLKISDSGWYECQLPTKPTQKNYIYLEVFGIPKIEANKKRFKSGDLFELTCHAENLPVNSSGLYWTLNNKEITPATVIDNYSFHNASHRRYKHKTYRKRSFIRNRRYFLTKAKSHVSIFNNRILNSTRLRISSLQDEHKGVYSCRYGKIETEYHLDFISEDHNRNQLESIISSELFNNATFASYNLFYKFLIYYLISLFVSIGSFL